MPICATYRPQQLPTARHCGGVGVYSESRGRTYEYNYSTKQIAYIQCYSNSSEPSLIHMNGRVYAPSLQRFLSPDPVLQASANAQNHNRYAYCLNNPLRYTDPSGYIFAPAVPRWPEGYEPLEYDDDSWGGSSGWARAMTPGMTYGWWAGLPAAAYGPAYYAYFGSDGSRNAPPSSHFDYVYGAGCERGRGRVEWKYRWESKPGKIQADGGIEVIGYKEWYVEWTPANVANAVNNTASPYTGCGGYGGGSGGGGIGHRGVNSIANVASTVNTTAGPYMGWGGVIGTAAERSLRASSTVDAATGVLKGVKVVGKGLGWAGAGLSLGVNLVNVVINPTPGNIAQGVVSAGIVGIGMLGPAGAITAFVLSSVDAAGGFDGFYEWIDVKFGNP